METKAKLVNIQSGAQLEPGWRFFSSRILGVEISFNVPDEWTDHADPLLGQVLFLLESQVPNSTEQVVPSLNVQRQDAPPESTLQGFTTFSIEQFKMMHPGADELKVIDTTLGGYEAAKAMHTIKEPSQFGAPTEGTVFQIWTKVHKYIFVLTFFSFEFGAKFKQQCNGVLQSFSFGNFRQEHVLMKTNQLISGFTLNSPITWTLEEETQSGKTESKIFYNENGKIKCQSKLTTQLESKTLFELTKDLKSHLLNIYHDTTITDQSPCKLGVLDSYRVEFEVNNCDNLPNRGILFIATNNSEWFSGSIFLSFLYHFDSKSNSLATKDLCERAAFTLELPMDPLDEDDRNLDMHTYENLNFGYRLKFNKDRYKPKIMGVSVKMLPVKDNPSMVQWPIPEISGTLSPQVTKVMKVDDVPVEEFIEGIKELMSKDPDVIITENKRMRLDDEDAMKLMCVHKTLNVRLTNYIYRKNGYWILLRSHSHNFEFTDEVYINEMVNSSIFLENN